MRWAKTWMWGTGWEAEGLADLLPEYGYQHEDYATDTKDDSTCCWRHSFFPINFLGLPGHGLRYWQQALAAGATRRQPGSPR